MANAQRAEQVVKALRGQQGGSPGHLAGTLQVVQEMPPRQGKVSRARPSLRASCGRWCVHSHK